MHATPPIESHPAPGPRPDPLAGTGYFLWTFRLCVYGLLLLAMVLGGAATRMASVLAALLVPLADRGGAVRHTLHLLGFIAGLVLIPLVGIPLGRTLSQTVGSPVGVLAGSLLVSLAPVLLSLSLGRRATHLLKRHRYWYVLNRSGGALLGVAEGGVLALLACWAFHLFGPALQMYGDRLRVTHPTVATMLANLGSFGAALISDDPLGRWSTRANPLQCAPSLVALAATAEVTADRETFWHAYYEGLFDDLLSEPAISRHYLAFRADPTLRRAAKMRDLTTLLSSPQYTAAINDDEFCRALARHWPALRARATDAKVERLHRMAAQLDDQARARLEQSKRRAREFGIEVPQVPTP